MLGFPLIRGWIELDTLEMGLFKKTFAQLSGLCARDGFPMKSSSNAGLNISGLRASCRSGATVED